MKLHWLLNMFAGLLHHVFVCEQLVAFFLIKYSFLLFYTIIFSFLLNFCSILRFFVALALILLICVQFFVAFLFCQFIISMTIFRFINKIKKPFLRLVYKLLISVFDIKALKVHFLLVRASSIFKLKKALTNFVLCFSIENNVSFLASCLKTCWQIVFNRISKAPLATNISFYAQKSV